MDNKKNIFTSPYMSGIIAYVLFVYINWSIASIITRNVTDEPTAWVLFALGSLLGVLTFGCFVWYASRRKLTTALATVAFFIVNTLLVAFSVVLVMVLESDFGYKLILAILVVLDPAFIAGLIVQYRKNHPSKARKDAKAKSSALVYVEADPIDTSILMMLGEGLALLDRIFFIVYEIAKEMVPEFEAKFKAKFDKPEEKVEEGEEKKD